MCIVYVHLSGHLLKFLMQEGNIHVMSLCDTINMIGISHGSQAVLEVLNLVYGHQGLEKSLNFTIGSIKKLKISSEVLRFKLTGITLNCASYE